LTQQNGKQESDIDRCIKYHFGSDYIGADFETIKPMSTGQAEALESINMPDILSENLYLYSHGNRTGKSYFLAAIYREILKKHGAGYAVSEVISDAQLEKDLIDAQFYRERGFMTMAYANKKYILFKDFGKCSVNKELLLTPLFDFFDNLFANSGQHRFYFASNYLPRDLAQINDKWVAIASRINEKCRVIEF
jgi:hypothetical protein